MIPKKDSKPILIKFPVGEGNEIIYENQWNTVYGIVKKTGFYEKKIYGIDLDFDLVITVNASYLTRKINKQTLFLCENMPTEVFKSGDYSPNYVYPEYNGEIRIGLKHKEDISIPRLYFVYNNEIISIQLNFDSEKRKAYIPTDYNLPFNIGDYVWTMKPNSIDDVENRLKLISKEKIGLSSNYKNFYELTFGE